MSVYKKLKNSDVLQKPLKVTQYYSISSSLFTSSLYDIDVFLGKNVDYEEDQSLTGVNGVEHQSSIYSSIKHLYYSNFLTSSKGDEAELAELVKGSDESGDRYIGSTKNTIADNYLQSDLIPSRSIDTSDNGELCVISVPVKLYGEQIEPGSLELRTGSIVLTDDREGNVMYNNDAVGNVIYSHGLVILTAEAQGQALQHGYGTSSYATSSYGEPAKAYDFNSFLSGSFVCSFTAKYHLQELQYKCTAAASEFNLTFNKTLHDGEDGTVKEMSKADDFRIFATTVGLYSDKGELLAVAKLAQPVPLTSFTDTNFIIRLVL